MYRKTSFGTQSPEESRFVERVLTTVATLKQQHRNALEFLTDAIRAHRRGLPPPSLLPIPRRQRFQVRMGGARAKGSVSSMNCSSSRTVSSETCASAVSASSCCATDAGSRMAIDCSWVSRSRSSIPAS